ncbi:MAG: hypothetical protein IJP93_10970 [Bacteroidales bacterium]|nr:hypothetical protein [Bacteroidales bacterium]MBR0084592.1 hypothetical protein [Bacteroidales bacterium]
MIEITISVGLSDAATKQQKYQTEKYIEVMKFVCSNYHVSFSYIISEGGYVHENGDYVQEKTLVLCLLDPEEGIVDAIARDLCSFFHQESVLITESKVRAYYIKEKIHG